MYMTMEDDSNKFIWWLASYPKSGNTWLRMFLSAYYNNGFVNINQTHDRMSSNNGSDLPNTLTQALAPKALKDMTPSEGLLIRNTVLYHLCTSIGSQFWLKTHHSNNQTKYGSCLIPPELTAGSIYIIRDPRDVVVSFAKHYNISINKAIKELAHPDNLIHRDESHCLFHFIGSWSDHVRSWTQAALTFPTLGVKYEEMIENPMLTFSNVMKFMNDDDFVVNEELLKKSIEACSFKTLQAQEKVKGFREHAGKSKEPFFRNGTAGQWKTVLTDKQINQIETDHQEVMKFVKYL